MCRRMGTCSDGRLGCRGLARQLEMRDDEALQPLERIRFLGVIERHNLGRRRLWRRVGELLAVGENVLELDVRIEVAEQGLRRRRPLVCKRRMRDQEKRRDERRADATVHAARLSRCRGLRCADPSQRCTATRIRPAAKLIPDRGPIADPPQAEHLMQPYRGCGIGAVDDTSAASVVDAAATCGYPLAYEDGVDPGGEEPPDRACARGRARRDDRCHPQWLASVQMSPHRPRKGLRPEAIDEFKRKHKIKTIAPFIADDFDEPLAEDFLLRPLPRDS